MKNPVEDFTNEELSESIDDYIDYVYGLHGVDEDNTESIVNILKETIKRLTQTHA